MNFWKILRWVGATLFVALVLLSWLATDPPSASPVRSVSEPPPAPTFR